MFKSLTDVAKKAFAPIALVALAVAPAQADIVTGYFSGKSDNITNSQIFADADDFAFGYSYNTKNIADAGTSQFGNILQQRVTISDFNFTSMLEDVNDNVIYKTSYSGDVLLRANDTDITQDGVISLFAELSGPITIEESSFATPDQFSQSFSLVDSFDFSLNPNISTVDAYNGLVDILMVQGIDPDNIVQQTNIGFDANGPDSGFVTNDVDVYSVTTTSVPEPTTTIPAAIAFGLLALKRRRDSDYSTYNAA